jgi:hypothetical protein
LFSWHSDPRNLHVWWADRRLMSFGEFVERFQKRLKGLIGHICITELTQGEEPARAGAIFTYNTDMVDRFNYICSYLAPEHSAQGIESEAAI